MTQEEEHRRTSTPRWWRRIHPAWKRYVTPVEKTEYWLVYSANMKKQRIVIEAIIKEEELPVNMQIQALGFHKEGESNADDR